MPIDHYHELKISGKWAEPVRRSILTSFESCGVAESQLAISWFKGRWTFAFYSKRKSQILRLCRNLKGNLPTDAFITTRYLAPRDWRDKWHEGYKPTPFGKTFIIIPAWKKRYRALKQRRPIYLDPGSAFGSGIHETTRHMIRLIEKYFRSGKSFLDLGTGTGLLSIAAFKLGAVQTTAIDYDRASVHIAKANYYLNTCTCGDFRHADLRNFSTKTPYDFVAANLTTPTLLRHQKLISRCVKKGGILVLSGVLLRHRSEFLKKFKKNRLQCLIQGNGRRWLFGAYKKG